MKFCASLPKKTRDGKRREVGRRKQESRTLYWSGVLEIYHVPDTQRNDVST